MAIVGWGNEAGTPYWIIQVGTGQDGLSSHYLNAMLLSVIIWGGLNTEQQPIGWYLTVCMDNTLTYIAWCYWVARAFVNQQNNWGTRWGEGGFARVLRGSNLLGLEAHCHYPTVQLPEWLANSQH